MVKKEDYERSQKDLKEQEKKAENALKEQHVVQVEDAIVSLDIEKSDQKTQHAIYFESLRASVDIDKVSISDRQKALEGILAPGGAEIDVSKLTPSQQKIVQSYQTKKYLEDISKLSENDKKNPEKLQTLARTRLGLNDFSDKKD